MKCSKCEKELCDERGTCISAFTVMVASDKSFSEDFLKKQMGGYELDTEYSFCYECLLDTMMGKK